jgi:hypothetical protein
MARRATHALAGFFAVVADDRIVEVIEMAIRFLAGAFGERRRLERRALRP